jgi:DnaJ-class molecular chaperone
MTKPRTKPCPECGGCGFVPHGCGMMTMTCPVCKGTGRIKAKKARKA